MKTVIVTDSTANLPEHLNEELGIRIVPLNIIWGEEIYSDGVDITPTSFYQKLASAKTMPTTSQPVPALFVQEWQKLLDEGYEILTITISGKLSGTYESAVQAKEQFNGAPLEILDGESASMGTGWAVVEAARAAKNGASLAECLEIAKKAIENTEIIFAVDTLEFLHRGGRIGGGARFIGTALNFKPILTITDGGIDAVERVRTTKKARGRLIELLEENTAESSELKIGVIHANNPDGAEEFKLKIQEKFNPAEIIITNMSPVIGTHTGPGTLGIGFYSKN